VVVGVVAYSVALLDNELYELGVHLGVVAKAEKGRFGIILVEYFQNLLGNFGRGSIVEREENPILTIDLPQHCGATAPEELWESEVHLCFSRKFSQR
jgi:hypothetical protein